jgi:hypothetical protein
MPSVYDKIAAFPNMTRHSKMVSAVTEFDKAEQTRYTRARAKGKVSYYNIWALPQYLGAIERAEESIAQGTPVRAAVVQCFSGRLLDAVLRAIGEPKATLSEL